MKIETETEKKIPALDPPKVISSKDSSFNSGNSNISDFKACLKELDENKKDTTEEPKNPQVIIPHAKNLEAIQTFENLAKKENIPIKINNIEDIKLFIRKKENLTHFDNDTRINLDKFKKEDIDFLKTCFENPSVTLNNLNSQNIQADFAVQTQNNQVSYKSFNVSKGLFNLMEYSFKAQKPVRVDFNGNSSVILKMHNDGKLIAEFVSNDKAMEYILKSSIPDLKSKLDAEGITYEKISYKDNSKNNNKNQNKGDNQ